jgi:glycosyltransferase involved in cell wall biosynthesis
MKNLPKISFLIAAHNEEKIIAKTLEKLVRLPYADYEVILGLDGCTDNTEDIVKSFCKKSKKIRYYKLNLRQGKPAVIDSIIKKASGQIIIIQDADWIFNVKNSKVMRSFISVFDDLDVGGIAESFPVQFPLRKNAGLLERGVMLQGKIWLDYLKEGGKKIDSQWLMADKNSHPLLVNIFRKNLYKKNKTLGDDFERFKDIIKAGKRVLVPTDPGLPRMITVGEEYSFRGLVRQKERTALARKQLSERPTGRRFYSFEFIFYASRKMMANGIKNIFALSLVNLAFIIGTIKSKMHRKISTKEGWKMRLER